MKKALAKLALISFASILFLNSCGDDEAPPVFEKADILVINEGNFGSSDGSISGIDLSNNLTQAGLFQLTNGTPVGSIIQNVVQSDDRYYIVSNSTDKVEVTDLDLKSIGTITSNTEVQFKSPFDIEIVGDKAYLSNWGTFNGTTFQYDGSFIAIINLSDFSISGTIPRDAQAQDLQLVNGKLYVTNVSTNTVSVIDPATDMEIESFEVPAGPDKMFLDKDNQLWVICTSGHLVQIDPSNNEVSKTIFGVQTQGFNEKVTINAAGDKIYYQSYDNDKKEGSIYEMDISATVVSDNPIVSSSNTYGFEVDNGMIYMTDHNGFVGNGKIYQYNMTGDLLNTFDAGRNPNALIIK